MGRARGELVALTGWFGVEQGSLWANRKRKRSTFEKNWSSQRRTRSGGGNDDPMEPAEPAEGQ